MKHKTLYRIPPFIAVSPFEAVLLSVMVVMLFLVVAVVVIVVVVIMVVVVVVVVVIMVVTAVVFQIRIKSGRRAMAVLTPWH